jgi:hypothetical protein
LKHSGDKFPEILFEGVYWNQLPLFEKELISVRLSSGGDPGDMSMASPENGSPETGGEGLARECVTERDFPGLRHGLVVGDNGP